MAHRGGYYSTGGPSTPVPMQAEDTPMQVEDGDDATQMEAFTRQFLIALQQLTEVQTTSTRQMSELTNAQAAAQQNIKDLADALQPLTKLPRPRDGAVTPRATKVVKVGQPDTFSGGKDKLKP